MKFEIEIPVAELKTVLPGFSKIVSRSGSLPVLQHVKIAVEKGERPICIAATNLDESAIAYLPGTCRSQSGELLVPLDELSKVIKGCTAGQSVRLIKEGKETRIVFPVAGNFVEQTIPTLDVKEW